MLSFILSTISFLLSSISVAIASILGLAKAISAKVLAGMM